MMHLFSIVPAQYRWYKLHTVCSAVLLLLFRFVLFGPTHNIRRDKNRNFYPKENSCTWKQKTQSVQAFMNFRFSKALLLRNVKGLCFDNADWKWNTVDFFFFPSRKCHRRFYRIDQCRAFSICLKHIFRHRSLSFAMLYHPLNNTIMPRK